ncbi:MAG: hypothetical protein QOH37_1315, partial [Nocardioidaceae bacterium]|nr:hypothetical protein [Nocardioidaceae bacterium]
GLGLYVRTRLPYSFVGPGDDRHRVVEPRPLTNTARLLFIRVCT